MVLDNNLQLRQIITKLSEERKLFHSEDDFKCALALGILQKHDKARVRCEKVLSSKHQDVEKGIKNRYIDIWVEHNGVKYGIELKYKTKTLRVGIDGESYNLREQGAQDYSRYGFIKDIERLEKFKQEEYFDIGYAIFLTNDHLYWDGFKRTDQVYDKDFRINEGRTIGKEVRLRWRHKDNITGKIVVGPSESTGEQSIGKDIIIEQEYHCEWKGYSKVEEANNNNIFKYILLRI